MPCPVAAAMTLSATIGGATTLVVHDRRLRWVSRIVALALTLSWIVYFTAYRTPVARIVLEVASVAALLAGVARVVWLVRREGYSLPMLAAMRRLSPTLLPVFAAPEALVLKTWLAAMVAMEWRGKAHFGATEYSIVSALLVAVWAGRAIRAHRARPRFAALESFARHQPTAACPLGFGGAAPGAAEGSPRAGWLEDLPIASASRSATHVEVAR